MNLRSGDVATLAVFLPFLHGLPAPSLPVLMGVHAICDREASVSVGDLQAVASYLDGMAEHPHMPAEAKRALLAVRDALLGRRVRNHASRATGRRRTGRRGGSGGPRRHVTATVDMDV